MRIVLLNGNIEAINVRNHDVVSTITIKIMGDVYPSDFFSLAHSVVMIDFKEESFSLGFRVKPVYLARFSSNQALVTVYESKIDKQNRRTQGYIDNFCPPFFI